MERRRGARELKPVYRRLDEEAEDPPTDAPAELPEAPSEPDSAGPPVIARSPLPPPGISRDRREERVRAFLALRGPAFRGASVAPPPPDPSGSPEPAVPPGPTDVPGALPRPKR